MSEFGLFGGCCEVLLCYIKCILLVLYIGLVVCMVLPSHFPLPVSLTLLCFPLPSPSFSISPPLIPSSVMSLSSVACPPSYVHSPLPLSSHSLTIPFLSLTPPLSINLSSHSFTIFLSTSPSLSPFSPSLPLSLSLSLSPPPSLFFLLNVCTSQIIARNNHVHKSFST